jgi:ribosomal protein L11
MNRTGRFASSAKITRASDKSLNFIYSKNPYGVFKSVGGDERVNHPRTRDPGKIIRAAIRELASNNAQEFFKNKLYIRED